MQTVLITGAASGIGLAAAQLSAARGWRCILVDRDDAGLQRLLGVLPASALGEHLARTVDLTDIAAIESLTQSVPELDALINNAGMSSASGAALTEQSSAEMERLLTLNLSTPAWMVDALAPRLRPAARVVNVASGAGLRAIPWRGMYSPSKAGVIAQTQALAKTRADLCVTVLSPGFVRTALVGSLIETGRLRPEGALAKIPLGRMAQPQEMAEALCFLASPDAHVISGQVLVVDGGSSLYGGSQPLTLAGQAPVSMDAPTSWTVEGDSSQPLVWCSNLKPRKAEVTYEASLNASALHCPDHELLKTLHAAAVRFAARHEHSASLTLLLPPPRSLRWQDAGYAAAAKMLISTLACEWGSRGLRINALEIMGDMQSDGVLGLVKFLGSSAAQYVTGQTLRIGGGAS